MAQPEVQDHNSPAVVTFMATEHFVLQTARSAGCLGGSATYHDRHRHDTPTPLAPTVLGLAV